MDLTQTQLNNGPIIIWALNTGSIALKGGWLVSHRTSLFKPKVKEDLKPC